MMSLAAYATVWLACLVPAAAGDASLSAEHARAQLLSSATAIKPGGTVTLAVQFEIEKDWHIYWRDHGGSAGLPTVLEIVAPAGWRVSPQRYPVPIAHPEEFGEKSFILEGSPAILFDVTAPADARPGSKATISANVSWLVCKKLCVKGDVKLSTELPVVPASAKVDEINADKFKKARRSLPIPAADAKYLKVRIDAGANPIKPGDKFDINVLLEVEKGYHIQ